MQEHQAVLAVLEAAEHALRDGPPPGADPRFWRDVLDFGTAFVDRWHHGKEEQVLFATMVRLGFPERPGPIAAMNDEHVQGRSLLCRMGEALAAGDDRAFAAETLHWIEFLRAHIGKEDGVLFVMARQVLAPADATAALADFARIERGVAGDGEHGRYLALARALCERQGVPFARRRSGTPHPGCCIDR